MILSKPLVLLLHQIEKNRGGCWLFIGGIFIATISYSWVTYSGDVSYGRLASKGFDQTLLVFNVANCGPYFSAHYYSHENARFYNFFITHIIFNKRQKCIGRTIQNIYWLFSCVFLSIFYLVVVSRLIEKWATGEPHPMWRIAQWCSTGMLWSVWLMQDAANIAVFLPRQLTFFSF